MNTAIPPAADNPAGKLSRDLMLRVCASPAEFRGDWLAGGGAKHVVPFPVPPVSGHAFAAAVTGAAAEMGADRLLACRTPAACMYEPVSELPLRPQAVADLMSRWGRPGGFLLCLPDESAAVLVSPAGYAVGAGPPPFLAALAGPDVAGARERFSAWAGRSRNARLREAAARYGTSPRPGSRPDFAERLKRLARTTTRRPRAAASLRFVRAAVGWEALAVIVLTMVSAPRASRVLPVIALACWVVLQVFVLARTHTVSWAACLRMAAGGVVCAAALSAVLHPGLSVHGSAGAAAPGPAALTGRVWAAPVEESVTLLPLAAFWVLGPSRARRLAAVDFLLLAAAAGAGFGLAETAAAALTTPGPGTAGTGWWHLAALLPGWTDAGGLRFPGHAVTAGLTGAGIGLAAVTAGLPRGGGWRKAIWLLPPLLFCWAVLDHMAYDVAVSGRSMPAWAVRLHAVTGDGHGTRWLLLALLAACVAVDYRLRQGAADAVPPLPGVPRWAGLARAERGARIRTRAQWPGTGAGRLLRGWAALRAGTAESLVEAGHEVALILVAARFRRDPPRPGPLPAVLAFVRERRELAMGAARAGGRARPSAPRPGLWPAWRRLAGTLGLGGSAALALLAGPPWPPAGQAVDLADRLNALHHWFAQFMTGGRWLIAAAAAGVLTLLVSGWAPEPDVLAPGAPVPAVPVPAVPVPGVPVPGAPAPGGGGLPAARPAARPVPVLGGPLEGFAPARLPLAAFQLAGMLLPRAIDRLLAGEPVARPYRWRAPARPPVPAARPGVPVAGRGPGVPAGRAGVPGPGPVSVRGRASRAPAGQATAFPADRVHRWLAEAPDFGVRPEAGPRPGGSAPGSGASLAEFTGTFTAALRAVADSADALRLDGITFRSRPVRAVIDRPTGRAVFFTPAGEFAGCARLTEEQLFALVRERRL